MSSPKKINVAIIYGGQSAEHGISTISAFHVANALDKNKYNINLIGITEQGEWYLQPRLSHDNKALHLLTDEQYRLPQLSEFSQQRSSSPPNYMTFPALDVVFPVLHGPFGEDGTIQGLLKLAHIPFVGSDVLSSAICMDKDVMKRLLQQANINIANFICVHRHQFHTLDAASIIEKLGLPCFVKPANMGSSIGIHKVKHQSELLNAIQNAFEYDHKVIIEAFIKGREIECAVLGNDHPMASLPGEIIPQHEFYDYQAKYFDPNGARLIIPAVLKKDVIEKVQKVAIQAFQALDCQGMARVDFFMDEQDKIYINELNTIPGFTTISMYPKMWEASGISYSELVDRLIELALERHKAQKTLRITPAD